MKALNTKDVLLSHLRFTVYMVILVVLSLFAIFCFMKTSEAEVAEIKAKTGDCEKIFSDQVSICDDYAELLTLYRTFDVKNEDVNTEFLMQTIANRKIKLTEKMKQLPEKDVQFHTFVLSKMDDFLRVRDSISALKKDELRYKTDLMRCNKEYLDRYNKYRGGKLNGTN